VKVSDGVAVSGGTVTVTGGWQAPSPANIIETTTKVKMDRLDNMVCSSPNEKKDYCQNQ